MKKYRLFSIALISLFIPLSGVFAQEVTLRFQHFLSPNASTPVYFLEPWAEKVQQESGGRIEVQLYPSMQLGGSATAVYDQIRDRVIDGGWAVTGYTAGRFPGVETFELPFISSTNAEITSKALFEFYEKYLQDEFADVKVLALHVHGAGAIHTKDADIENLDDFDGLKLRAPTRIASKIIEQLGSIPVGMPLPQLPESLSKGVVDGGVIPLEIVPQLKMHELATAHTIVGGDRSVYNIVFVFAMNKSVYEGLPDELKSVIDNNSGLDVSAWAGRAMDTGDVLGAEVIEQSGNAIHLLSEDDIERMKQLTQPIIDNWISEMTEQGWPAAQMVEDARALVSKYEQE